MAARSRVCAFLLASTLLSILASAQEPDFSKTIAATDSAPQKAQPTESLGDAARKMRSAKPTEVKTSPEDAKELFALVDEITTFASEDSGFPRKTSVKRRLISQGEAEAWFRKRLASSDYTERISRAEVSMKKFGLLPREFDLREFVVKSERQGVAGFYDEESKMISLLNWVSADSQKPILAHELTHALQDQNYDLKVWQKAAVKKDSSNAGAMTVEDDESSTARHAVVEGQAMVVYMDYLLAPLHRTLKDTPGIIAAMEEPSVVAAIDTEVIHNAPVVFREAGSFPYRDGLLFEAALLEKGGKKLAFTGVFAHPPKTTHEVLQPKTYLEAEHLAPATIPDMQPLLSGKYEVFDTGSFGELDVRALLKQLGEKRLANDIAAAWQGGSYVTFKHASAANPAASDVALLYVSHWKTAQAAERFGRLYAAGTSKRYKNTEVKPVTACTGAQCPVGVAQISTEEGPVIIEQWANNTVVISESFDTATAAKLNDSLRSEFSGIHTGAKLSAPQEELSMRLMTIPAFQQYQNRIGAALLQQIANQVQTK
jgi:hypothetical protein